jgi:hypothetical protein
MLTFSTWQLLVWLLKAITMGRDVLPPLLA